MRDNDWLEQKLEFIWQSYFADVKRTNNVNIKFGKRASTRLGSIKKSNRSKVFETEITMTGFFKDERVPEYIIDLTIAHELCHYVHGFSSPLPQLFKYPHLGGLVDKELIRRGMGEQLIEQKKWLKKEWTAIVGNDFRVRTRRRPKAKRRTSIFDLIFG